MTYPIGSLVGFLDIQGIPEADAALRGVQRSLDLTGESAGATSVQFDRTGRAMLGTSDATAKASASVSRYRAAQLSQIAAQERYNTLLESGSASTRQLASSEAALVRANERVRASAPTGGGTWWAGAAKGANEAAVATDRAAGSMRSAVSMAGQLGVAFGVFELARKALDIGKQAIAYQADMTRIRSLTGASADEIRNMNTALLQLAGPLATAPADLAISLYHVESIGLRGAAALDAVTVAAKGAKIGNADLEETTNALTATIQSGIAKNQSYSRTMSDLLTIVGTGDMKLSDFNESLSSGLLSIVSMYGVKLPEVGAALATFGDNNIRGANAATFLRTAVQSLAVVAPKGQEQLLALGIGAKQLTTDLQKGGLLKAVTDLKTHLDAAHITGDKVGATLTQIFTKRAGPGLSQLIGNFDLFRQKLEMIDKGALTFGQRWDNVRSTASFALKTLGAEADAAGVTIAEKATPAVTALAHGLAAGLPAALAVVQDALHPFGAAWHDIESVVGPVGHGLSDIGGFLKPIAPAAEGTAAAVLSMWLAFKGYQIAAGAVEAVRFGVANLAAGAGNSLTSIQQRLAGNGTAWQQAAGEAELASRSMQAEFAAIAQSAQESAATQAEAQLAAMRTYQQASVEEIAAMEATAEAAREAATASAAAAETAAAEVDASGAAARAGWAGVLGPIGLAVVGVTALVSMFHHSTSASKEATDAAKAYTDALSGAGSGSPQATILDTVVKQMDANNIPGKIKNLNSLLVQTSKIDVWTSFDPGTNKIIDTTATLHGLQQGLAATKISGSDFLDAITKGGPALDTLRSRLEKVRDAAARVDAGTNEGPASTKAQAAYAAAGVLLKDLNTQYSALSKAQITEITRAKSIGLSVAPLQDVAKVTHLASQSAQTYAQMLGYQVTKAGDVIGPTKQVAAGVQLVADAYAHASQSGDAFLAAMKTFSSSAGTANDRAALIGATLKASNGDALAFAATLTASTSAVDALGSAFVSERQQLAQQSATQTSAAARVHAAQLRLDQLRSNSKTTASTLASAERSLADAQTAAGKSGALAYADTERAAIRFRNTQHGVVASINTSAAGAGSLVSQLQAIQDAAAAAAGAEYQHQKSIEGGKKAADDAYNIYVSKTKGALIAEASQLGLTTQQAAALAKAYMGTPKKVKTLIETEGDPLNKVEDILTRIGKLLAHLTGQQWNIDVAAHVKSSGGTGLFGSQAPHGGGRQLAVASGGPITGSGPKGVDSVPLLGAPGEWMMTSRAVDKYGPRVMAAMNAGTFQMGSAVSKSTHVDKVELNVSYPLPERTTDALPRLISMASDTLGSL